MTQGRSADDTSAALGATARLLWEACRRDIDADAVGRAIAAGADLDLAVTRSVDNRVAALLWRALHDAGLLEAVGGRKQVLEEIHDLQRFEGLLHIPHVLSLAMGPLCAAGLEPVVLKGPAVARCYPEPGLRPMDDIDLLLPWSHHERAVDALTGAGWGVIRPHGRDHYDTVLAHPEATPLLLELHYGLEAAHEMSTGLDPLELWRRRVPISCLGVEAFGLPVAEELVMLATHAAKPFHGFARLVWIADIAMVVGDACERGEPVDWAAVASLAQEAGCVTQVAAALRLAERVGVQSPGFLSLPQRGWRASALATLFDETWPVARTEVSTFHLRYALVDSWTRRARLMAGTYHDLPLWRRLGFTLQIPFLALRRWFRLRSAGTDLL
jgi:hypothetical protein